MLQSLSLANLPRVPALRLALCWARSSDQDSPSPVSWTHSPVEEADPSPDKDEPEWTSLALWELKGGAWPHQGNRVGVLGGDSVSPSVTVALLSPVDKVAWSSLTNNYYQADL